MTPYERGYAAGLKAAAALVPTDDTRELCCNGYDCECRKPEDAAFVAAEIEARRVKKAILSLPIEGEATNPGEQELPAAAAKALPSASRSPSDRDATEGTSAQQPASPGPCVVVPRLNEADRVKASRLIAVLYNNEVTTHIAVEAGAMLQHLLSLAAAREEHDAHR